MHFRFGKSTRLYVYTAFMRREFERWQYLQFVLSISASDIDSVTEQLGTTLENSESELSFAVKNGEWTIIR